MQSATSRGFQFGNSRSRSQSSSFQPSAPPNPYGYSMGANSPSLSQSSPFSSLFSGMPTSGGFNLDPSFGSYGSQGIMPQFQPQATQGSYGGRQAQSSQVG